MKLLTGTKHLHQMKSNAKKMAPGANHGVWKDNSNFFHKGTNQRWQGVLTEAQSRRYEQIAAERLAPELDHWLARGSI